MECKNYIEQILSNLREKNLIIMQSNISLEDAVKQIYAKSFSKRWSNRPFDDVKNIIEEELKSYGHLHTEILNNGFFKHSVFAYLVDTFYEFDTKVGQRVLAFLNDIVYVNTEEEKISKLKDAIEKNIEGFLK